MISRAMRKASSDAAAGLQELHGVADGRQRIAQFVRQRGEEFVLALVSVEQ